MLKEEFEQRIDKTVSAEDWDVIHHVYQWDPDIKDVGGKDQIAGWYKDKGISGIVYNHLAAANHEYCDIVGNAPVTWKKTDSPFVTYEVTEDGHIINEQGRPIADVYRYVREELRKHASDFDIGYGPIDEYFDVMSDERNSLWPTDYTWIAVFAVTGGSEGHYIHVEAINGQTRRLLFLGKTFHGLDHAYECCRILSHILEV